MTPYADIASPMLVKEIRQDLRTRAFTGVFIWYHAALILTMVVMLASQSKSSGSSTEEGAFFWMVVALPSLALIPLRGLVSFHKETRANALELLFLTKLTAWQVVCGKWASLSGQALLFLCAALPYAFLRFFLGNVSISESLLVFAGLVMGSMLTSAATVAISALGAAKEERMAGFFVGIIAFGPPTFLVGGWYSYFAFGRATSAWIGLILLLLYGTLGVIVMLEVAAWRIATPSENHALRLRGIGLITIALSSLFCFQSIEVTGAALGCAVALLLPIFLTSLCETPRFLLGIFDPFVNGSVLRYRVRWLFYPGWPSGVLYVLVATLAFSALANLSSSNSHWALAYVSLYSLGIILAPLAVALLMKRAETSMFRAYALSQLGFSIAAIAIGIVMAATGATPLRLLLRFIPHSAVFFVFERPNIYSGPRLALFAAFAVLLGSLLVLAIRAGEAVAKTREAERRARAVRKQIEAGNAG